MAYEYGKGAPLSYNKYLKVPELIELQETLSEPASHDELLFIVIHQTYELWFKQILHEIDATINGSTKAGRFGSTTACGRSSAIEKVLVTQIHLLETMAQIGFLEFRDKLNPASGFQSMQFRELEFVSGAKERKDPGGFQGRRVCVSSGSASGSRNRASPMRSGVCCRPARASPSRRTTNRCSRSSRS